MKLFAALAPELFSCLFFIVHVHIYIPQCLHVGTQPFAQLCKEKERIRPNVQARNVMPLHGAAKRSDRSICRQIILFSLFSIRYNSLETNETQREAKRGGDRKIVAIRPFLSRLFLLLLSSFLSSQSKSICSDFERGEEKRGHEIEGGRKSGNGALLKSLHLTRCVLSAFCAFSRKTRNFLGMKITDYFSSVTRTYNFVFVLNCDRVTSFFVDIS